MTRRFLLVGLCLAVLASGCGSKSPSGPDPIVTPPPDNQPPPPPPVPPRLGITRILAFGDSMTYGRTEPIFAGLTLTPGIPQSYPFKLQAMLTARYTAQTVAVANAGNPGEKAAATAAPTARDRLAGAMSEAKPELLLLLEGANDLNSILPGSTNVSPIVGALEDMVRDATARGVTVMLATLPPQRAGGPRTALPGLVDKYNRELRTMAGKKGATLIDVNALLPLSLIGQDGLHPTEEGYQRLAEIFMDAIKAKYESGASTYEPSTVRSRAPSIALLDVTLQPLASVSAGSPGPTVSTHPRLPFTRSKTPNVVFRSKSRTIAPSA